MQGSKDAGPRTESIRSAAISLACTAGAAITVLGAFSTSPGLRLAAISLLCYSLAPLSVEIRPAQGGRKIRFPLVQPALFAASLALSPAAAAVPGAVSGIGRVAMSAGTRAPLCEVLYTVFRPALVCSSSALAFSALGGNSLLPYGTQSVWAAAGCAAVYIATGAVLAALRGQTRPLHTDETPGLQNGASGIAAVWAACLSAGYVLSVVYALAPAYTLVIPAAAAGAVRAAMSTARRADRATDAQPVTAAQEEQQPGDVPEFIDRATGLANRRYLEMFLRREISRAERIGTKVAVVTLDIQHLRGHAAGDDSAGAGMFYRAATRIRACLREYDLAASFSPGRVVVVLPETGTSGAVEAARRLHRAVTETCGEGEPVRADAGIAVYPDHGSTFEDLINASHHALNKGRAAQPGGVHACFDLAEAGISDSSC